MMRWVLPGIFAAAVWTFHLQSGAEPPKEKTLPKGFQEVSLNGHRFQLPLGFSIELAASSPLIERPITAALDDKGRLYVTDSSGSNEKVAIQLEKKPHRVVRLEDRDGDGRYDHSTVFAEQMMFPEGSLWFQGSLYVAAPPSIWKLTDTNDDGVADERIEWFKGKTLTGCANDLHGPYEGPDGWIYWCKGAFALQEHPREGKSPFTTRASHIFRCRPDGTGLEAVMTGGMDNPVDTVFTPGGERIFTTTFFQHPGNGLRDGLIHAAYGGVYGKVHEVLDNHPWTSPEVMPVLSHMGAAAPSGLVAYEGSSFGRDFSGNLFACQFNMRKISRHELKEQGGTFTSADSDFLVSDHVDFHPTDIIEDADGSLLVMDTGGWYKLCCPTSQLVKPDVKGAIYRVRKTGAARLADPWGLKIPWTKSTVGDLADLLDDSRPAVCHKAMQTLAKGGAKAIDEISSTCPRANSGLKRLNAVWALTRIEGPEAREAVRKFLNDIDAPVQRAALNSISLHRDRLAAPALRDLLSRAKGINLRLAIESLGRVGYAGAVPELLKTAATGLDRFQEHAITYALYEIGAGEATAKGLQSPSSAVRKAALVSLELMGFNGLKPEWVTKELGAEDPGLRNTAWWLVGKHPQWGDTFAKEIQAPLFREAPDPARAADWVKRLSSLHKSPLIGSLIASLVKDESVPKEVKLIGLKAMAAAGPREFPISWIEALTSALDNKDAQVLGEGLRVVRLAKMKPEAAVRLIPKLLAIGENKSQTRELRLNALAGIPGGLGLVTSEQLALLIEALDPTQPVPNRLAAAETISKSKFTPQQLVVLGKALGKTSAMEADRVLDAFAQSRDPLAGKALVEGLLQSPARFSLRLETLKQRLGQFGPEVEKKAQELYSSIEIHSQAQIKKLEEVLPLVASGDIRRGQLVFKSAKTSCLACHAIGYLGGKTGPDLTRIGQIRTERDLLESILFPSASFVRSYEPVKIALANGKVLQGLVRSETATELVIQTGPDQESRISRQEIEVMEPSTVSVMPAGLDNQLTSQELADLVAFLKACK